MVIRSLAEIKIIMEITGISDSITIAAVRAMTTIINITCITIIIIIYLRFDFVGVPILRIRLVRAIVKTWWWVVVVPST